MRNLPSFKENDREKNRSVLLADDDVLTRELLGTYLDAAKDIDTVRCGSKTEIEAAIQEHGTFDVLLVDYLMPGIKGPEDIGVIVKLAAPAPVILISGAAQRHVVYACIDAGISGFFPKSMSRESFMSALGLVMEGEKFFPSDFYDRSNGGVAGSRDDASLSGQERKVLSRLCQAMNNQEIAEDLEIKEVTVKVHVSNILQKLGAKNRTHAVLMALGKVVVPEQARANT